jgi:peptidoglycan/LPS O-acetylase OafA/YrhL
VSFKYQSLVSNIYSFYTFTNQIKTRVNNPLIIPDIFNQKVIPGIDGLRALSILIVLISHIQNTKSAPVILMFLGKHILWGSFGVYVFFVISGFLITGLILKEKVKSGSVNLKSFYWRRFVRIFPVYYFYLLTIYILNCFFNLKMENSMFISAMLYLQNFPYFAQPWINSHSWSLAVEEQFYLIWPSLLVFGRFNYLPVFFIILILLAYPILNTLNYFKPAYDIYFLGSLTRNLPAIMMGSFLSLALFKSWFSPLLLQLKKPIFGFCLPLAWLSSLPLKLLIMGYFSIPFGFLFTSLFITLFLLHVILQKEDSLIFKVFNHKIMVYIGRLSYSIYIWQQIFLIPIYAYPDLSLWWTTYPLNILLAFLTAMASYHFLEMPLLKYKRLF